MSGDLSQHPADRLVRDLIRTGRSATTEEIEQIIERMATAPFNREVRRVPRRDRGASYQGRTLGASADSLIYHLTKRGVIERQWMHGTTARQYIGDLRRSVRSPDPRLALYASGVDNVAASIALTEHAVPSGRRGPRPERLLLVVYSANRGIIVTGYQVSSVGATSIPREARWLR